MQKITKKIFIGIVMIACVATFASPASAATVDELQAQISALLAQITALQAQLGTAQTGTTGTGACTGVTFSRSLKLGMAGNDVKCLQAILNQAADTRVSVTGAGAPGTETTYFGAKTTAAVIKFQAKYASEVLTPIGLTAGTGLVGSRTIAKLNTMIGSGGVVIPGVTVATARLASDNPAASAVPTSAGRVPLLKVVLQSAGQDVTVNSLTFKRTGIGATTDWTALYLYVDDVRVTTYGRTISVDDQTVEFPTLNFTIPAGGYKTITLRGDVYASAGAGSQHAFQLISSNVAFSGLPLTGNTFTIGGVGVSTVTISAGNSVTNPIIGTQGATIGSFKVTAGNQDVSLKQVILTMTGTIARAGVTNIKLYYEDQLLGQASGIDTYDNVTVTLTTPFTIAKTLIKTFTIKADLAGKTSDTLVTKILETGDVLANDNAYGFGSIIASTNIPVTCGSLTLKGGTVSLQDLGPVTGKISKSSQDVTLTKFSITANRSIEVIRLGVLPTAVGANTIDGDDTTLITDLRIKDADTGATLMTGTLPTTATTAGVSVITMTGSFNIAAGATRNLIVTVDIGNSSTLNSTTIKGDVSMVTYGTTQVYIRDVATGEYLQATEIVPTSVSGDAQTIEASSLTVSLNSNPISQVVVTGVKDVPALGILLTAGAGSDINVRQIDATIRVSTSSADNATSSVTTRDKVQLVKLYDGTTLLSQKVLDDSGTAGTNAIGTVQFDGLNVAITKNTSKVLTVKIDTASNLTATYYASVAVATSTVDAKNANGDTVAATGGANTSYTYRHVTIQTKGTLASAAKTSATPVSANIAVGGEANGKSDVTLLAFDLSSTKEDIKVTKIQVAETGSGDGSNFKAIYLYDGSTMIKGTVIPYGTSTAKFDNLEFIVPANTTKTLTVKADLAGVDGADVTSGEVVAVALLASTTEAIGNSSGQTITINGAAPAGNDQYIYKSALEAKLASNSPSGSSIKGGAQDVLHLDLTNIGTYDAYWASTTFTIGYTKGTGGNGTTSAIRLASIYDSADLTTVLATTSVAAATDLTAGTATFTLTPSTPFAVGAGQTKTLVLKFDTSDVGSSGGAAFRFDIASVGNFSWYDGTSYVQARTRYLPIVGGTCTY